MNDEKTVQSRVTPGDTLSTVDATIAHVREHAREWFGNDPEVIPTTMHVDIHAHPDEIEVRQYPPPENGNPRTVIRFGNVRNNASLYVNDREAAEKIVAALQEIIRGWPEAKAAAEEKT